MQPKQKVVSLAKLTSALIRTFASLRLLRERFKRKGEIVLFSEAFAKYGAKLKNLYWSVSAQSSDGALVISCWKHRFSKPQGNTITYKDYVERWSGPGNQELRANLDKALETKQRIRAVIARTSDVESVENGGDASHMVNEFHVREDWIGELLLWDGNNFEIKFVRQ